MIKAELHVHSNHSDGRDSVKKIILRAVEIGIDAIAITDHDTLSGSFEAMEFVSDENLDIIVIPGVEISTSEGHLLAYGIKKDIESGLKLIESVREVRRQNGIAAISHPFQIERHGVVKAEMFRFVDAIEVFNAKYITGFFNYLSFRLAKKYGKAMIAGSDAHRAEAIGYGITNVFCEDIIRGIKLGKTEICGRRIPLRLQFF